VYEERNRTLVQWIPWIQKKAHFNFKKYDFGFCQPEDVIQVGCIAAIKSMDEGKYKPFRFVHVNRAMWDFVRHGSNRKERKALPYIDEYNGKYENKCKSLDVKEAIKLLDTKERVVIILTYWHGMEEREIMKTTGMSRYMVQNKKKQALRRLHEILHPLRDA